MSKQNDRYDVVADRPLAKERLKPGPPPSYAVVMLDDDLTPMDFVVLVLISLFNKTEDEAEIIMMDVHEKGKGVAGSYTREIAETRVVQVHEIAQANEHPFQCEMEPVR
jgi:ATP-dependent Clp protease adaptor protein ClpS